MNTQTQHQAVATLLAALAVQHARAEHWRRIAYNQKRRAEHWKTRALRKGL